MSQVEDHAGLVTEFASLAARGSGSPVVETCSTLLSLRPVSLAIEGGALGAVAARTLLEIVARQATEDRADVRAAAALTGITPRHTGRGVRDDPGPHPRQKLAGAIAGGLGDRTMREAHHRQRCYKEYAEAVLDFVRAAGQDQSIMESFLLQCGVTDDEAARLVGRPVTPHIAPVQQHPRSDHPQLPERATTREPIYYARQILLSGVVRQALDAARTSCEARGRAFYTLDLLLALLDLPHSRTADCLEQVEAGMTRRVRAWLHDSLSDMNPAQVDPFQPFEWTERPDVQIAQDLAALDGSAVVTEIYLLLGVLGNESNTRGRLVERLGPAGYDRLCAVANERRRHPTQILKTPGPG